MNSFRLTFLVLLIPFITSISCQSEHSVLENSDKELFNKWQWVESSGGISGVLITPSSEGFTKAIKFISEGIYIQYKNGKEVLKEKFSISKIADVNASSAEYLIDFEGSLADQSFKIKNDTLILSGYRIRDGFTHIYIKIRN